jgi:hypothetical protein
MDASSNAKSTLDPDDDHWYDAHESLPTPKQSLLEVALYQTKRDWIVLQLFLIEEKHCHLPIVALFFCLLVASPSFGPQLTGIGAYILCDKHSGILLSMDNWHLQLKDIMSILPHKGHQSRYRPPIPPPIGNPRVYIILSCMAFVAAYTGGSWRGVTFPPKELTNGKQLQPCHLN